MIGEFSEEFISCAPIAKAHTTITTRVKIRANLLLPFAEKCPAPMLTCPVHLEERVPLPTRLQSKRRIRMLLRSGPVTVSQYRKPLAPMRKDSELFLRGVFDLGLRRKPQAFTAVGVSP